MDVLAVLLLLAATARVTSLITTDFIFEPLRSAICSRVGDRLAYLIRCDWCMSVWVGVAVFLFGWYAPDTVVLIVSGALAGSLVTGWLSIFERTLDE